MDKIKTRKICVICIVTVVVILGGGFGIYQYHKIHTYNNLISTANKYMDTCEYDKSIALFEQSLKYKKDSNVERSIKLAENFKNDKIIYDEAVKFMTEKKYLEAKEQFKKITKANNKLYSQAQKKILECDKMCIHEDIKKERQKVKFTNYRNKRYGFSINYPSNWTNLRYPTNGDGCTLYDDGTNVVSCSGVHDVLGYEEEVKICVDNLESREVFITDSGEKGEIIIGRQEGKHEFYLLLNKEGIIFDLYCGSNDNFYYNNKELLYKMAKSFKILDASYATNR